MRPAWRIMAMLTSAFLGWLTVSLVFWSVFAAQLVYQSAVQRFPLFSQSQFVPYLGLAFETLIITMPAALIFFTPYFLWRSPDFLLLHPLRIFIEPACIIGILGGCLIAFVLSQGESFGSIDQLILLFAMSTCLASSGFYLLALRRAARKQAQAAAI